MDFLKDIQNAGIVGCGGAGFPTHVKYNTDSVEYLIINGAECEPLLRTDRYIMKHRGKDVIQAAEMAAEALGASYCCLALKEGYKEEIKALEQDIKALGSKVRLVKLDGFYPAGDEQMIVYEVTGRTVPPSGIPIEVGCVVSNVATILAVGESRQGIPLVDKYLTVTGNVVHPVILKVPVGTSFNQCIELAGGAKSSSYFVVSGGPAMGAKMTKEQADHAVVTKTTSGIIVLPKDCAIEEKTKITIPHMLNRARSACIQCSLCTQMCPRHLIGHPLEPHRIMRKLAVCGQDVSSILNDPSVKQAAICCECGVCEIFACPMGLQPRRVNHLIKEELRKQDIRYERPQNAIHANSQRDGRKIPASRIAARLGVGEWYDLTIDELITYSPDHVEIPMRMHIGMSAQPIVSEGDHVVKGQLIGQIPEGKMGALVHASIEGIVQSVGECIIIERTGLKI